MFIRHFKFVIRNSGKAEQALVAANRELIRRMEAKVKAAIDRVWGSGEKSA